MARAREPPGGPGVTLFAERRGLPQGLEYLQRCLNELSFRFNNRRAPSLFGMTARRMALAGAMTYAQLVEENAFTPFIRPK